MIPEMDFVEKDQIIRIVDDDDYGYSEERSLGESYDGCATSSSVIDMLRFAS